VAVKSIDTDSDKLIKTVFRLIKLTTPNCVYLICVGRMIKKHDYVDGDKPTRAIGHYKHDIACQCDTWTLCL